MPFMVYFLEATPSIREYVGWTCGGTIVSPIYIITSAACVEDVKHMYAIAGYEKFVESKNIDNDACTKNRKKKIVLTCVPKLYELDFMNIEKWATLDIAVVKVESPYDFNDMSYAKECSFIPKAIRMNYEAKYQRPDTEVMVLGWGHNKNWRSVNDYKSYNTDTLHYASNTILCKSDCKKHFDTKQNTDQNKAVLRIIDKYMICTLESGNLDDQGELVKPSKPNKEGCLLNKEYLRGEVDVRENYESVYHEAPEEQPIGSLVEVPSNDEPGEKSDYDDVVELDEGNGETVVIDRRGIASVPVVEETQLTRRVLNRRNGICQNDHGGPLLTWIAGQLVLIGVASVFKLVNRTICAGPNLFTSTHCNGKFLDCLINGDLTDSIDKRNRSCDESPEENGYHTIRRKISWIDHPDGPAENERIEMRPQIPLYKYHPRWSDGDQ